MGTRSPHLLMKHMSSQFLKDCVLADISGGPEVIHSAVHTGHRWWGQTDAARNVTTLGSGSAGPERAPQDCVLLPLLPHLPPSAGLSGQSRGATLKKYRHRISAPQCSSGCA